MDTSGTSLILRRLERCTDAQRAALREVRNEPGVREMMYTTHEIGAAEHVRWLERVAADDTVQVFAVLRDGAVVGAASISGIDRRNGTADWAFYLSQGARGGIGRIIETCVLDHVFGPLGLAKLNCEVLAVNAAVIALHGDFGFVHEGTRRAQKLREGARVDVVLLGITAGEWQAARGPVMDAHAALLGRFDVVWDG